MPAQFCTQCGESLEPQARFCTVCGAAVQEQNTPTESPRQRKLQYGLILILGGLLLLFGVLLLLNREETPGAAGVPDDHDAAGVPFPDVPRISVSETRNRFDAGTAVIVDVRSAPEYAQAHIPNALSIPLSELQRRYQELSPEAEIITYCT